MPVVEFHDAARAEADEAFDWYRLQNERNAERFLALLEVTTAQIAQYPRRERIYLRGTRRALLRPFPYLVVYRELGDAIQIVAVAHGSRRRGYWVDRL